jgi:hypothetical protein
MSGGIEACVVLQLSKALNGTPKLTALFSPTRPCTLSQVRRIHCTTQFNPLHNSIQSITHHNSIHCTTQFNPLHNSIQSTTQHNSVNYTTQFSPLHNTIQSITQHNSTHYTQSNSLKIHFSIILPSAPTSSKWSLAFRFSQQTHIRMWAGTAQSV